MSGRLASPAVLDAASRLAAETAYPRGWWESLILWLMTERGLPEWLAITQAAEWRGLPAFMVEAQIMATYLGWMQPSLCTPTEPHSLRCVFWGTDYTLTPKRGGGYAARKDDR